MRTDADLPHQCVWCARPADVSVRRRLYWAATEREPAGGALDWVPFLNVVFAFQDMARWLSDLRTLRAPVVTVPMCRRDLRYCWLLTAIAYAAFPAGIWLMLLADTSTAALWSVVIGLAVSAICWSLPRPVKAVHVGVGHVTLAGVCASYLRSVAPPVVLPRPPSDPAARSARALRERLTAKKAAPPSAPPSAPSAPPSATPLE
jgi:hypothetical protein